MQAYCVKCRAKKEMKDAKAIGFWTCWVNRSGAPADELGFTPDVVMNNLTDLVNTLITRS